MVPLYSRYLALVVVGPCASVPDSVLLMILFYVLVYSSRRPCTQRWDPGHTELSSSVLTCLPPTAVYRPWSSWTTAVYCRGWSILTYM